MSVQLGHKKLDIKEVRETIPWQRKESFTTKRNLRQVLVLHDREVVSAIVQIAGLPPYWAVLQSLDLLCV